MFNSNRSDPLRLGQAAPTFDLNDQSGNRHTLASHLGKWLVIYFYPKDDTPGCTKEACAFRDEYKVISATNTQVLGISIDKQTSHAAFAEKYQLPFPLLADTNGEVAKKYHALTSLGPVKFAKRHTFIVDPQGNLQKIYRKVNAAQHSQQIIHDLKLLQA